MLEQYFVLPETCSRIRASWLGRPIQDYVDWLSEQGYSSATVQRRVAVLMHFADCSAGRGATRHEELPDCADAFIAHMERNYQWRTRKREVPQWFTGSIQIPVEQMLRLPLPDLPSANRRRLPFPFRNAVPGFFDHLLEERGLQLTTLFGYAAYLRRLERFLDSIGLESLGHLSPAVLSAFTIECGRDFSKSSMHVMCSKLRIFLRHLHRAGLHSRDLSTAVEGPRVYRLSAIPRSVPWPAIERTLSHVDRRTPVGKRDYAILLLLVVYGLRAREVAPLTFDSIDWERETLLVVNRKGGRNSAFPLACIVAEAVIDYLRHGRPNSRERALFLNSHPPFRPIHARTVSARAAKHLTEAGVEVHRAGSHTLRHSCVQRLIDARFPLKTIGDFIDHRSPDSTEIYAKVSLDSLREIALGDGEAVV